MADDLEMARRRGDIVQVSRAEFEALLAVATTYVEAFTEDEMMTLPQRMRLQEVEDILERHGKRY